MVKDVWDKQEEQDRRKERKKKRILILVSDISHDIYDDIKCYQSCSALLFLSSTNALK
jgi:hypothetical protein